MDDSISDLFSTSDIFDSCGIDSDFNHLRIIFEDVLCSVSYVDVESNVFCEEIPKLKELCDLIIVKITEHLQNTQNQNDIIDELKTLIQRYSSLILFANNAVNYIKKPVKFEQVRSLPLPICEILFSTFKHCKDSDQLYGRHFATISPLLTDLFKKTNQLQSNLLKLLNNFIQFNLDENNQNVILLKILENLSNIGEIISNLDIKSTAELWKGFLVLTQTNIDFIRTSFRIEKTLQFLCKQVVKTLSLCENDTKIETHLKLTSFNLKIIIKLCGLYDEFSDAYADLYQLLIVLNRYFGPFLCIRNVEKKIVDLMQMYVFVAAEPLLGCIVSNREFFQYFIKTIKSDLKLDDNRLGAVLLVVSIMKKNLFASNTSDAELQQIWMNCDILCIVFDMLELLHAELSIDLNISIPMFTGERDKNGSLYEYLLIYTVSFMLQCDKKHFKFIEKLLFESIMQTNVWRALFAADLWCILARYGPETTCFKQLHFLISVFVMFTFVRNKPQLYFLQSLIFRLFQLLTKRYQNDIVAEFTPDKYPNLWFLWKIERKYDESLVVNYSNTFLKLMTPINYQNMMKSFQIIQTIKSIEIAQKLGAIIRNFWLIDTLNFDWQFEYIWIISKTTVILIQYLNNKDLLTILDTVIKLSASNKRMHLINCMILKSLATKSISPIPDQSSVFTKISDAFKSALKSNNVVIQQRALETFTFFAQHTIHETILSFIVDGDTDLQQRISHYLQKIKCPSRSTQIDYFRRQSCVKFRHECCASGAGLEPLPKKQKCDNEVNVEGLLARIKYDTDLLCANFVHSIENVNRLSCIVEKLKQLLQK